MNAPDIIAPWDESDDAISERAAAFFGRRRCGEWTDTDQAGLDAWLAESTSHYVAYLRIEGIAARADQIAALRSLKLARTRANSGRRIAYRRFVFPLLAAASIALIAALGIPFATSLLQPVDRTYSTDVGGRTTLKFGDGTVIDLNTDTLARFRMTNEERTVWLERGEAWFHVAHNAANPFTVVAGRHRVTDLGTEFLVRRATEGLEVALVNGRAALSTEGAPVAVLTPGEDAVATPVSVSITRKTPQELADELAWRRGVLVFRDAKLADAVREVNRYNTIKIVIADPSIADRKFTGEIPNDTYESFLRVAETMMKLRVDRQGKNILLSRDVQGPTRKIGRAKHSP